MFKQNYRKPALVIQGNGEAYMLVWGVFARASNTIVPIVSAVALSNETSESRWSGSALAAPPAIALSDETN